MVNEDAIRQRAYYLWEADGRPDGRHDHYWSLAHQEATKAFVEATGNGVAKATRGKNPSEIPAAARSPSATRMVKAQAAKVPEAKVPRKADTRPRAAVPAKKTSTRSKSTAE